MAKKSKNSSNKGKKLATTGFRWHSAAEFEEAIKKHYGVVTAIANELGITRKAVYSRLAKSAHLRQIRKECEITITHKAEHNIYRKIIDGHVASSIFFLRTKGRARGWAQDNNVTINNFNSLSNREIESDMSPKIASEIYRQMIEDD